MTTCVPIKLGGVRTHRLVMRVMCWQPGKTGILKKTKKRNMTIREYAADCVRQARSNPMIAGEVFEAGIFKIHNEEHKRIYIKAFKEAFPNWAWKV